MIRSKICISLLLALITLAVYWQTGSHEFINYDDNIYVTNNPHVKAGLTWEGLRWAFTSTYAANWHPLTWLSHMLDVQIYGLAPQGHHLTNVLLHAVNALLLFLLLSRSTGDLWPSAFAAALFALHPLRVESVAWVAERKDLLSTLFALLSLLAYTRYTRRPAAGPYLLALVLFVLGLMAKPMLVTLPLVMLLLDYWPLYRLCSTSNSAVQPPSTAPGRLFLEKIPFFSLAAASCLITVHAQQSGRTLAPVDAYPLLPRIENAVTAYAQYLRSLLYPVDLAVFYPLPNAPHPGTATLAALLLIVLSIMVLRARRQLPFLVTGWFWYLGTLVPVIGLVQVGMQSRADRYTYLPMIGIALILAWGAERLTTGQLGRRRLFGITAVVLLLGLTVLTWRQTGYWRDTQTLFRHAIAVTDNNYVAQAYLGSDYYAQGRYQEAAHYYALSLTIKPHQADIHHNIGLTLNRLGDREQAEFHLREATRLMPDLADTRYELALLLANRNEFDAAINELVEVLRQQPNNPDAHLNLGITYARQGKIELAMRHFTETLRLVPGHTVARRNLERCRQALEPTTNSPNEVHP